MTIAFTIPFWVILIILVAIGVIGFIIIANRAGDYDFLTPVLAVGFAAVFIILAIGLALGKYVFNS